MILDKIINAKGGFSDGIIVSWDIPGLVLGYLCEKVGVNHCFVGRQVDTGEITEFFSSNKQADRYSIAYQVAKGAGFVAGLSSAPITTPMTLMGNTLRYCSGYYNKRRPEYNIRRKN